MFNYSYIVELLSAKRSADDQMDHKHTILSKISKRFTNLTRSVVFICQC
jgi:hypothetical protein